MNKRTVYMKKNPLTARGKRLAVGELAPDFKLLANDLSVKTMGDYHDMVKLISVVPSLDTGVCDLQTRNFNEDIAELKGATVITVSVDLPFAQKRWCGNAGLDAAITLSDHRDVSFGESYGVLIDELRLLARAVFVLDKENKVTYVEYLEEMTEHPNYEAALEAIRALL
ncbi:MAG TPA: thiol peroxidase [Limnochordia bacterium]|nr:thiol peroxidase [Limnochordia bacterium]